jgi:NAD(P)-dependent dehydrogenase (short-subunit alcohol dehydrogenase family)
MKELEGKVALVTGAGQGVGEGIALALAAEGVNVVVTGRTEEKLVKTVTAISDRGGKALAVVCNVKSSTDMARAVDETVSHFGGLNILVNNAQEVRNCFVNSARHIGTALYIAYHRKRFTTSIRDGSYSFDQLFFGSASDDNVHTFSRQR